MSLIEFLYAFFRCTSWAAIGFAVVTLCLRIYARKKRDYVAVSFLDSAFNISVLAAVLLSLLQFASYFVGQLLGGFA